MTEDYCDGLEK